MREVVRTRLEAQMQADAFSGHLSMPWPWGAPRNRVQALHLRYRPCTMQCLTSHSFCSSLPLRSISVPAGVWYLATVTNRALPS